MRFSPTASLPETLVAIAVAIAATALLVAVAAFVSMPPREMVRLVRTSRRPVGAGPLQLRQMLGFVFLGVVGGIPMALGLLPVNAFVLIAALTACMVGRGMLSGSRTLLASAGPFVAIAWAVLAGVQRFKTFDLGAGMGAQSYFGAAGGFDLNPFSGAALAIGLLAAALWTASLPALANAPPLQSIDQILRIGEGTLAASAVAATLWGPSLGALVRGPLDLRSAGGIGYSFLVTMAAVALVALLAKQLPRTALLGWVAAAASLVTLVLGEVLA